jgi:hypothetical protein
MSFKYFIMTKCKFKFCLPHCSCREYKFSWYISKNIVLRLRTNTVRTEHRTLYSSPNVRTTPIATLRFSKDHHHCGNVNTYALYYTYICSRLCTLVPRYVLTVTYVCVRALLLNGHLIKWPYCGRILSMPISIANIYN